MLEEKKRILQDQLVQATDEKNRLIEASDRTAKLFTWQAKLAEKFGVGSIVRVLSDRKTV